MDENQISMQGAVCPIPLPHDHHIVIGHGSGGKMTHDLVRKVFLSSFKENDLLGDDGAVIPSENFASLLNQIVISTDSHVVTPLFFPGGDIGRLAICGTVNDVAMMGAIPLYLTAGFILEEGLEIATLKEVVRSMKKAADEAGVKIIAGDTKVVQKGQADGLFITTSGFGFRPHKCEINGASAKPGDLILISGTIGDHGIAILSARGELGLMTDIRSDVAPLNHLVHRMTSASGNIHVLRDPTRGGLATTLNEIAVQSQVTITIDESKIPIHPSVQAACEMLGFDPLYVANEGKLVAIVAPADAEIILEAMHSNENGKDAAIIGQVDDYSSGQVLLRTSIGTRRILTELSGELLPRIC